MRNYCKRLEPGDAKIAAPVLSPAIRLALERTRRIGDPYARTGAAKECGNWCGFRPNNTHDGGGRPGHEKFQKIEFVDVVWAAAMPPPPWLTATAFFFIELAALLLVPTLNEQDP